MRWLAGFLIAAALAFAALEGWHAPAQAQVMGAQNLISCNKAATYSANRNGATEVISPNTVGQIYICGYTFAGGATGAVTMQIVSGTRGGPPGTGCSADQLSVTPAYSLSPTVMDNSPLFRGLVVQANRSVCISTSASTNAQALIYYSLGGNAP